MRVLVMHNPIAGRGRSGEVADRVRIALLARGIDVDRRHTPALEHDPDLILGLRACDAAVIVGGDGAIRRVASALVQTHTPAYNVPCGTENLFARQFGMCAHPDAVAQAVERMAVQDVDVGRCGDDLFVLMCGVGADASIVHRLARHRHGAITHASYIRHVLAELATGRSPTLTIRAGGLTIVDSRAGAAVIANSSQYALRIDPARGASMRDGLLDLVFFPASTSAGALLWGVASRLRLASSAAARRMGVIRASSASFELISHDKRGRLQCDGDAVDHCAELPRAVSIQCHDARLRVLLP